MDLKGDDLLRASFPNGTKVKLACNLGYSAEKGSLSLTCTAGSWNKVTLICESEYISTLYLEELQVPPPTTLLPSANYTKYTTKRSIIKDKERAHFQRKMTRSWKTSLPGRNQTL